jgi:hypothetical protein
MDSLIIEATEDSPSVIFDTTSNRFIISGESRPENAGKFYTPVIDWLVKFESILYYRKQELGINSTIVFIFQLDYFNSTSAKYLMDIILTIKNIVDKGHIINIEWIYDKRDDDMLDVGKEFSEMAELKFNFVEV